MVEDCITSFTRGGGNYTITVGEPTTKSANYLRSLELTITRSPYNSGCPKGGCSTSARVAQLDKIEIERFVPVRGSRKFVGGPGAPPKSFTVPTRERLVYGILHDPPGGLSYATWKKSTKFGEWVPRVASVVQ
jgi:hypothetical protein